MNGLGFLPDVAAPVDGGERDPEIDGLLVVRRAVDPNHMDGRRIVPEGAYVVFRKREPARQIAGRMPDAITKLTRRGAIVARRRGDERDDTEIVAARRRAVLPRPTPSSNGDIDGLDPSGSDLILGSFRRVDFVDGLRSETTSVRNAREKEGGDQSKGKKSKRAHEGRVYRRS